MSSPADIDEVLRTRELRVPGGLLDGVYWRQQLADYIRAHNDPSISELVRRMGPVRYTNSVARIVAARRLGQENMLRERLLLVNEVPGDVMAVGDPPEGFGQSQAWNGEDDLAVVAFINAADDIGVQVTNVRDGDTFQLVAVSGDATFAVETENEYLPGLISAVAVAADITATAFDAPEVIPAINDARNQAEREFAERQVDAKPRNAFGQDRSGTFARQEGGVIICAPAAHQFYKSGDDSDAGRRRWLQGQDRGDPRNLPAHILPDTAFFLTPALAAEPAPELNLFGTGTMFLGAWDGIGAFRNNTGFYEVSFILRRYQPNTTPIG